jgi:hypothetical protein
MRYLLHRSAREYHPLKRDMIRALSQPPPGRVSVVHNLRICRMIVNADRYFTLSMLPSQVNAFGKILDTLPSAPFADGKYDGRWGADLERLLVANDLYAVYPAYRKRYYSSTPAPAPVIPRLAAPAP